jgi:CTP synthase
MNSKTKHPVIDMMSDQKNITKKGGTMRLGSYVCELTKNSIAYKAYDKSKVNERHRHRYEFNPKFQAEFEANGMHITGVNPETKLAEIVELKDHPYFIGVQFHPEYKSTVLNPDPLFVRFLKAAVTFNLSSK